ncbi:ACT domain-containing protein ACR3-like isoform X2 [Primulina tabacum]|uniref:ACT domain-containing protein ACR3-like isoform X2 n=1 Tax=Primulina tabacum TaxID=48773 RepID=UPI003F59C6C7
MGSWAYFDPEYETLNIRINPPQVSVDNSSCKDCTLVKVDSMNKPGILLEVVQILTDLDLIITKAYISSDGGWFMDVFHVTDEQGRKIWDSQTIEHIEKALGPKGYTSGVLKASPEKRMGVKSMGDYTTIELIGRDRPGLLSEISAALANLHINVASAEVWTHNSRIACVLYVNDNATCCAVTDASRLSSLEEQLKNILQGCGNEKNVAHTSFSIGSTHIDRRLHQLLFADRDYECTFSETKLDSLPSFKPKVVIERCEEKDYLVVSVRCKDRPKLMFDIVCTLTDMQYVVFHATISSDGPYASQLQLVGIFHSTHGWSHIRHRRRESKGYQMSRGCNPPKNKRGPKPGNMCKGPGRAPVGSNSSASRKWAFRHESRCLDCRRGSHERVLRERCFWESGRRQDRRRITKRNRAHNEG